MAFKPKFARPPCVTEFSGEQQFIHFLLDHKVPYWKWGEEDRLKAWKEVVDGDVVYSRSIVYERLMAVRCIYVIAARVKMTHPVHGTLVLVEYTRKGDLYLPRRQADSSLSEKMLLDQRTGLPAETPEQTIIRCFEQETGIRISPSELSGGAMLFLRDDFRDDFLGLLKKKAHHRLEGFGVGAKDVEQDYAESSKYPGLVTYRQVAKYVVELDHRHYRATGYRDPGTRYYSKWRSVHEKGVLQAISASAIKRKRAVA